MKRLIALLIVLALCFCSCASLFENADVNSDISSGDKTPDSGDKTPDSDDSDPAPDKEECTGAHSDENNDGVCDYCDISVIVVVDIFAINDLHGKITSSDSQYGIGGLTTYLKKETDDNSILLSSGDMWQGSSESNLTYGALITDWMSELGFVSMTLGNHEYDWAESYIANNAEIAEFPLLAINVYDSDTNQRAEYAAPSVVVERDGVEIGIIGAVGDCYSSISGDVRKGFYFKTGSELTALVKAEADRLRAEGVDFIVYSIHDGYGNSSSSVKTVKDSDIASYYDTSLSNGYVDIVFEAHTHQSYILKDSYGVYHVQGGGENKKLSRVEIKINSVNGNSSVSTPKIISQSTWRYLDDDPIVAELLAKYEEEIAAGNVVLGNNRTERKSWVLEQKIADLYYEFGVARWGDEYDIILGGGFVRTRNPYDLASGSVKYSDVYSIFPFDNNIVLCSISGYDLYYKFLTTDNSDYYVSSDRDIDELIEEVGNNFSKTYYIVVDTYTSTYPYNNCTEIARCTDPIYARDLLAEYIKAGYWA